MWIAGIDVIQEKVLGQGPQNNESAIEQAKDEQMSDFIRSKVRGTSERTRAKLTSNSTRAPLEAMSLLPISRVNVGADDGNELLLRFYCGSKASVHYER